MWFGSKTHGRSYRPRDMLRSPSPSPAFTERGIDCLVERRVMIRSRNSMS